MMKNSSGKTISCSRSSEIIISSKTRMGKERQKIIQEAFEFFLEDLDLSGVTCRFNPVSFFGKDVFGLCLDGQMIFIKNKVDLFAVLSTIAHELRHCFQWESGTMSWVESDETRIWLGRVITDDEVESMDYWETPWEIDAMEYENKMEPVIENFVFDYLQTLNL